MKFNTAEEENPFDEEIVVQMINAEEHKLIAEGLTGKKLDIKMAKFIKSLNL